MITKLKFQLKNENVMLNYCRLSMFKVTVYDTGRKLECYQCIPMFNIYIPLHIEIKTKKHLKEKLDLNF